MNQRNPKNPRLVLLVKQLFLDSRRLLAAGDELSAMKAVLFMDLAVEQMLHVLAADLAAAVAPRDEKWDQLWQRTSSAVVTANAMKALPNHKELRALRDLRNLAQHSGVAPNPAELSRFIVAAETFLTHCCSKVFGLNLSTFSLVDAIRNPDLCRLLRESQAASEAGDLLLAAAGAEVAFRNVIAAIRKEAAIARTYRRQILFGHGIEIPVTITARHSSSQLQPIAEVARKAGEVIANLEKAFIEEIDAIRDDAVIGNLGISMAETGRYQRLRKQVVLDIMRDGSWNFYRLAGEPRNQNREDTTFALSYVTGLTLLAQDSYPEAVANVRILKPLSEQPVPKRSKD